MLTIIPNDKTIKNIDANDIDQIASSLKEKHQAGVGLIDFVLISL